MQKHLLLIVFLFIGLKGWGQIVVTNQSPALAQSVVINKFLSASGVFPGSVVNAVVNTGFGNARFATFLGTSNIGFTEGVILSTGNALNIPNPATLQIDDPLTNRKHASEECLSQGIELNSANPNLNHDMQKIIQNLQAAVKSVNSAVATAGADSPKPNAGNNIFLAAYNNEDDEKKETQDKKH